MAFCYKKMHSPLGELTLVASQSSLVAVMWADARLPGACFSPSHETPRHAILTEAERQLQQYFTGHLQKFDLPLEFVGTSFQKQVWAALIAIPYGETRSYGQIAQQIGHPSAVRAVGAANGRNPLPIVAPCHRVIGSNGKLTGFAGGLASKAFLLRLENGLRWGKQALCR